jgi:hypothetical protein
VDVPNLFRAWNPPAGSRWEPYAKLALLYTVNEFSGNVYPVQPAASLESITAAVREVLAAPAPAPEPPGEGDKPKPPGQEGGGRAAEAAPASAPAAPPTPEQAAAKFARSAVILDLPGPQSVAWAAALARDFGHRPVPTVNNVPHQAGVVPHHQTLGALLYYARQMDTQVRPTIKPDAPPAFILERQRIRNDVTIGSTTYDNRYYHVEGDFPAPVMLKAAGIDTVWYVYPTWAASPHWDSDDMNAYLVALDQAGIAVVSLAADCPRPEAVPTAHKTTASRSSATGSRRPSMRSVFFMTYIHRSAGGFGGYAGSRVPSSYGSRSSYGSSSSSGSRTFSSGGS